MTERSEPAGETGETTKALEVEVHGYVQGVGFRYSCQAEASRLGVRGWARNNDFEGTVSGHFEGHSDAVDALVDWCRQGPRYAQVTRVDVHPASTQGHTRFSIIG
ncbi:MAG: acylphosphatase [Dermatophilus congolensis]|nr:acylphosphatase [Dermatophilus congolensis]